MPDLDAVYRSCINQIISASPDIKPGEAKELLKRLGTLGKVAKLDPSVKTPDDIKNIMQQQLQGIRVGKMQKQYQIAQQKTKFQNKVALVDTHADASKKLDTFIGNLLGTYKEKIGGRDNTDARINTGANQVMVDLKLSLDGQKLWDHFTKGIDEDKVARELSELNKTKGGKPGTTGNKDALRVAKVIKSVVDKHLDIGEKSGIFVDRLEGYSARQSHDPDRIRQAGFDAWAKGILPMLDKIKTFGDLDPAKWMGALDEINKNILSGRHLSYENGVDNHFKGAGSNLAAKANAQRVLHFNSVEDAYKYNQQFGARSFREQILSSLSAMGRRNALADDWGPNAELNMENVLNHIANAARDQRDEGTTRRINGDMHGKNLLEGTPQQIMDTVLGKNKAISQRGFWYQFNQWVHTIKALSSLGGASISAQSDLINLVGHLSTISGNSPLTEMAKVATKYYLPHSSEVERISEACNLGLQAMRAQMINDRFGSFDTSGTSGKVANFFFHANVLHFHDVRINNVGAALMSQMLGNYGEHSFETMPIEPKTWLQRYNITASEWEGLRNNAQNKGYITPIDAEHIPGLSAEAANNLRVRVGSMFTEMGGMTVPRAGAREQAILYRGTKPTTWAGSIARMLLMYKTFPLSMVTKVLNRNLYGQAKGTLSTAASAGLLFGMYIAMGAGLIYGLKQLLAGKTTPQPNTVKGARTLLLRGLTAGGGAGFFGDIAAPADDKEKLKDTLVDLAAGPVLGSALKIGGLPVDLAKGNVKPVTAEKQAVNFAADQVPFSNYFATKFLFNYYVRYAILNSIDPDYTKKIEKNMQKNDGTKFIIPPAVNAR